MFTSEETNTIEQAMKILASKARFNPETFDGAMAAKRFFQLKLAHLEHEVFAIAFLDSQHRLIAFEEMFRGTIDAAAVYPREVVKEALKHNAKSLVLGHCHPSNISTPSQADKAITRRLSDALELIDVRVLDHIVACLDNAVSFAEEGLL